MEVERRLFYPPEEVVDAVGRKVKELRQTGERIDYLTFVPDGEPTLDVNLGLEIDLLKALAIPIAVITNSSLIWQHDVRTALMKADLVSVKLDAVEEALWRKIDRAHKTLRLDSILDGIRQFAASYQGSLITETMLLADINYSDGQFGQMADFLAQVRPEVAYLGIPTRPPAQAWAQAPGEEVVNRAYQIFSERLEHVEYLTGYEGNAFAYTGNVEEDILSITAVHPMREDAVDELLKRTGVDWTIVRRLVGDGQLSEIEYGSHKFYLRKFSKSQKPVK